MLGKTIFKSLGLANPKPVESQNEWGLEPLAVMHPLGAFKHQP
jgi:hypothetical protein